MIRGMTREEAIELARRACKETWNEKICKQIRKALEPKTGRWQKIEPYPMMEHEYKCSECYNGTDNPFEKYCSECDAKMEVKDV